MLVFSKILRKWPGGRAPVEHIFLEKCIIWKAPFHMRQVQFITLMTFFFCSTQLAQNTPLYLGPQLAGG